MLTAKNVLVATDFSPASDAALNYGRALARTFGATLHVMHAIENPFLHPTFGDPETIRANVLQSVENRLTAEDRATLGAKAILETSDHPSEAIVDYARRAEIDLIVMGTHGRGGLNRILMGSVAEHVVRTAPCPVLTVRHPERDFVTAEAVVPNAASA